MVIDFPELQELSGCKQPTKVCKWLQVNKIPHVVGYDGKPRTTQQWMDVWHDEKWQLGDKAGKDWLSEIRFKA